MTPTSRLLDDQVRRGEFAQLRQIRRRQAAGAARSAPSLGRLSGALERAGTLRKIDAIEALMAPTGAAERWPRAPSLAEAPRQPASAPAAGPDPRIEEAALSFAGGDLAGAQSSLEALRAGSAASGSTPPGVGQPGLDGAQPWLALFDLYVATGQAVAHESLALEFAQCQGRSPPPWRDLSLPGAPADAVLRGEVQGEAAVLALLRLLEVDARRLAQATHPDPDADTLLVVDCSCLARIDFPATCALLNWVQARRAEGVTVEFCGAHRLVASLFQVVGLGALARIRPMRD